MIGAMKDMPYVRRFVLILCLLIVFLAALALPGTAFSFTVLLPTWFFFAAVISLSVPPFDEHRDTQLFPALPVFSPRPPPAR